MPSRFRQWREQGNCGKDKRKHQNKNFCDGTLGLSVVVGEPSCIENGSADEATHQQAAPGFGCDYCQNGQIQQADIGEEHDLVILSRGKKNRRAEASDQGEGREDLRILSEGEGDGETGHHDHGGKRQPTGDEVVDLERTPER